MAVNRTEDLDDDHGKRHRTQLLTFSEFLRAGPDDLRSRRVPPSNPNPTRSGIAVPVTCARDSVEHLVCEEAMTSRSAGCYVAVCGRSVRAAALACPPGPRCPACTTVLYADRGSERRRHRQRSHGLWAWLNLVRRRRHRAAETTDGPFDAG
jgi:hypothetical protein